MAALVSTDEKPRRRRTRGSDRWLGEVKGILAILVAGFGLVALLTFDSGLPPAAQNSPTGPIGVWIAWAISQSFGYAGFLLPILLGAWGASAFVRPLVMRGMLPFLGLAVLLVSATGLLTLAIAPRPNAVAGGIVGRTVTSVLSSGFGNVGTWFALLAAIPIGVLCVTRVSYAALARVTTARFSKLPRRKGRTAGAGLEPAAGIKVSQVVNLADDLALALKSASVRIVGPIPGRGTVAMEVPNSEAATVYLREIFVSAEFAESKGRLPLALGKDVNGTPVVTDLTAMPHLLVAGATGSGKSVAL